MRKALPFALAIALVAIGFTQLSRYNVTWDEALGDFFFGQRYLSYFTSFDSHYLDFAADPYPPGFVPDLRSSEFRSRPWEYWPVANTLAAATSRALMGVVDPFDGFHAFNLIAGAVFLLVFYRFLEKRSGTAAAVVAVCVLFLMPRIVADLLANIKDFPEMVFFSLALIAFFVAYERGSLWGLAGSGVLWGLALGTKANAWFAPLIVVLYIALRGLGPWRPGRLALGITVAALIGVAVMFAAWPYLWADPVTRFVYNIKYLTLRVGKVRAGTTINPWFAIFATTPPLVLILAAAGMVLGIRRRDPLSLFLLAWIGVVGARLSIGTNFDGVRHFLEIFPPIAAFSGIATAAVATRLRQPVAAIVAALPIAATAWATISTHPFETAYWNAFVGGLSGAQKRGIAQSSDYWGASYRLGLDWLNANAPQRSVLIVPIAGHTVQLVAPLRLRGDIAFVRYPRGGGEEAARQRLEQVRYIAARAPLYVMFVPRRDWSTELDAECMRRLTPVQQWTLEGAPILLIYRYVP